MRNRAKSKFVLDVLMVVTFIVVLASLLVSTALHIISGLLIMLMAVVHVYWNWSWVKHTAKNLRGRKNGARVHKMLAVNAGLALCFIILLITGIMMSVVTDPVPSAASHLHQAATEITLVLLIIHLFLHKKYIAARLKKVWSADKCEKKRA